MQSLAVGGNKYCFCDSQKKPILKPFYFPCVLVSSLQQCVFHSLCSFPSPCRPTPLLSHYFRSSFVHPYIFLLHVYPGLSHVIKLDSTEVQHIFMVQCNQHTPICGLFGLDLIIHSISTCFKYLCHAKANCFMLHSNTDKSPAESQQQPRCLL